MVAGVERDKTVMYHAGMEEDVKENMGVVAADEDKERVVVDEERGVVDEERGVVAEEKGVVAEEMGVVAEVEEGGVEREIEVAEKTRVAKERELEKEKAKAIKPYELHILRD